MSFDAFYFYEDPRGGCVGFQMMLMISFFPSGDERTKMKTKHNRAIP